MSGSNFVVRLKRLLRQENYDAEGRSGGGEREHLGSRSQKKVQKVSDEGDNVSKIRIEDIASLTDFHRNSTTHCKRLKKSGRPELLTVNGRAVLVVQDAAAYQRLLEAAERSGEVSADK